MRGLDHAEGILVGLRGGRLAAMQVKLLRQPALEIPRPHTGDSPVKVGALADGEAHKGFAVHVVKQINPLGQTCQ
jgi:hypothetical protein